MKEFHLVEENANPSENVRTTNLIRSVNFAGIILEYTSISKYQNMTIIFFYLLLLRRPDGVNIILLYLTIIRMSSIFQN